MTSSQGQDQMKDYQLEQRIVTSAVPSPPANRSAERWLRILYKFYYYNIIIINLIIDKIIKFTELIVYETTEFIYLFIWCH